MKTESIVRIQDSTIHLEWIKFNIDGYGLVSIGLIDHKNKTVGYCHGYYPKNPLSKRTKGVCKRLGYTLKTT